MKTKTLMKRKTLGPVTALLFLIAFSTLIAIGQNPSPTATAFAPLGVPKPGPTNDAPYSPQPILPGGVVVALYPPGSPFLKMERVREAEYYNVSKAVPGRISWITNIHNPSIEVHTVEGGLNTGCRRGRGARRRELTRQLVYTDTTEPEIATIVREGDVVLMPQGHHPNVAAPGGSINFL